MRRQVNLRFGFACSFLVRFSPKPDTGRVFLITGHSSRAEGRECASRGNVSRSAPDVAQGRCAEAETLFAEAALLDPTNHIYPLNRAAALEGLGRSMFRPRSLWNEPTSQLARAHASQPCTYETQTVTRKGDRKPIQICGAFVQVRGGAAVRAALCGAQPHVRPCACITRPHAGIACTHTCARDRYAKAYYRQGRALERLGRESLAADAFRAGLRVRPSPIVLHPEPDSPHPGRCVPIKEHPEPSGLLEPVCFPDISRC